MARSHRGFFVLSGGAVAVLLVATHSSTFFHDDWAYIDYRSFADPATWFIPHVQHFVALHVAVFLALVSIFGTATYLPFMLVMFAAHVAFTGGIYALIDRHVGRGPALGAAAILLLLGSGWNNLFWAFQMGPIASVALAFWGLLVIRERPVLAAVLMGLGASTALYAFIVVPAALLYGWSRRAALACAVPAILYASWYVAIGRAAMVRYGDPPTAAGLGSWLAGGVESAAAGLTGLGVIGLVVLAGTLVLVARIPERRAAAVGIAVLLTEYVMLGLGRQGANLPDSSTYTYFGSAFLLPVFATAWPAVPRLARPAARVLIVVALVSNVLALAYWSSAWPTFMSSKDPRCLMCQGYP